MVVCCLFKLRFDPSIPVYFAFFIRFLLSGPFSRIGILRKSILQKNTNRFIIKPHLISYLILVLEPAKKAVGGDR